ncbi:unnamed protein product [Vitrella brassicaformis CCMP3155]|uniref:Uncharacterized protein n=2 Tax=Vitrella brassicaformis TaxID=1169539 RepID=A0A0G4ERP6_VITBC|nr:unnamed protein product [Vitrella brassicaformis CCMP3155]|eukprot:CEM00552.1 unnamed protein product [Vitrella brassicaformis CCMP3155]
MDVGMFGWSCLGQFPVPDASQELTFSHRQERRGLCDGQTTGPVSSGIFSLARCDVANGLCACSPPSFDDPHNWTLDQPHQLHPLPEEDFIARGSATTKTNRLMHSAREHHHHSLHPLPSIRTDPVGTSVQVVFNTVFGGPHCEPSAERLGMVGEEEEPHTLDLNSDEGMPAALMDGAVFRGGLVDPLRTSPSPFPQPAAPGRESPAQAPMVGATGPARVRMSDYNRPALQPLLGDPSIAAPPSPYCVGAGAPPIHPINYGEAQPGIMLAPQHHTHVSLSPGRTPPVRSPEQPPREVPPSSLPKTRPKAPFAPKKSLPFFAVSETPSRRSLGEGMQKMFRRWIGSSTVDRAEFKGPVGTASSQKKAGVSSLADKRKDSQPAAPAPPQKVPPISPPSPDHHHHMDERPGPSAATRGGRLPPPRVREDPHPFQASREEGPSSARLNAPLIPYFSGGGGGKREDEGGGGRPTPPSTKTKPPGISAAVLGGLSALRDITRSPRAKSTKQPTLTTEASIATDNDSDWTFVQQQNHQQQQQQPRRGQRQRAIDRIDRPGAMFEDGGGCEGDMEDDPDSRSGLNAKVVLSSPTIAIGVLSECVEKAANSPTSSKPNSDKWGKRIADAPLKRLTSRRSR